MNTNSVAIFFDFHCNFEKKEDKQILYCTYVIANVRPNFGFFHCLCVKQNEESFTKKNQQLDKKNNPQTLHVFFFKSLTIVSKNDGIFFDSHVTFALTSDKPLYVPFSVQKKRRKKMMKTFLKMLGKTKYVLLLIILKDKTSLN